jgi:hypothetical protein
MEGGRTTKAVSATVAIVAAFGLAACGGSGASASKKSTTKTTSTAQQAQAQYQKCNSQLHPLLSAEENLDSHLDIGMNYDEYTNAVGDAKAAYDQIPFHQLGPKCLLPGISLENAMNDFAKGANTWTNCFNKLSCSNDSIKPQLQAQWSKAHSQIDTAKTELQALQTGA